ncbi:MAG: ATP-binding protein, partial [Pseudomonadota bacterium]|nr:ATP-binding protein [Pseudomonadota bacterium]
TGTARADPASITTLTTAAVTSLSGDGVEPVRVALPDDWSATRPRFDGSVWYHSRFDTPAATDDPLGLFVERACNLTEVRINGHRIFRTNAVQQPVSADCRRAQLVSLPAALLRPAGNAIDILVTGKALSHVTLREFAGSLSPLRIGPQSVLAAEHARRVFWTVSWIQSAAGVLMLLGAVMLILGWQHPHEIYFGYFGGVCLVWALLTLRLSMPDMPWPEVVNDYAFCIGLATLVGLAVQFLLGYAALRSRWIESALVVQWLLLPATLLLGGSAHRFAVANSWYLAFAAELFAAGGLYLIVSWRDRRHDFWPMAGVLGLAAALVLAELESQLHLFRGLSPALGFPALPILMPLLFLVVGWRLFMMFARALPASEAARATLAARVRELTMEFESNFSYLAEQRLEQVTVRERKRIAADLHDDLGAKLLTIVHTSGNERISALGREALEDMRLSVKGLIGKPMKLADALADWRAETVARLGQAQVEVDWQSTAEESEHLLPSRGFVQITRIVRESVSNIVKHSRATRCKVRCSVGDGHFALTIQDNGGGIPTELDGRLDRGLGMSNMKRRAKQMRGQCLVQSGPGYGTVIALTVPL